MRRLVNGVEIELSPEEIAAEEADQAARVTAQRNADMAATIAEMKALRMPMLQRLDSIITDTIAAGNTVMRDEAIGLKTSLLGIVQTTDLSGCQTRREMQVAFRNAWKAMAKPVSKGGPISVELYNAWGEFDL